VVFNVTRLGLIFNNTASIEITKNAEDLSTLVIYEKKKKVEEMFFCEIDSMVAESGE
jgi:hypothetical protein